MKKNNLKGGFSGIAAIGIIAVVVVVVVIMFGYSISPKVSQKNEIALPVTDKVEEGSMAAEGTVMDKAKDEKIMANQGGTTEPKDSDTAMVKASGSYQIYDPAKLAMADNGGKVILFFNASWCPTCHSADAELKSSQIPDGLVILSVDYDKYTELKKKYGITYQHTFVQVDAKGNLISKWSGGGLADIISHVK